MDWINMEKKIWTVKVWQVIQSISFDLLQEILVGIEQYVGLTNDTREQLVC